MWAHSRRTLILSVLGAIAAAIVAVTLIAIFYQAPSCSDNKQNQGEDGVDCGGPCSHLCTMDVTPASVRFVRQLPPDNGHTDVIAYIDNPNQDAAAKNVQFTLTLYAEDGSTVANRQGSTNLAPKSATPVFLSDVYSGSTPIARAFLTFDQSSFYWYKYQDDRPILNTSNVTVTDGTSPRITADVANPTAYPLDNIPVVVTVFDANNNAIAASETLLDQIPPQGTKTAVFTWNEPFSSPPAREEVISLVPLP